MSRELKGFQIENVENGFIDNLNDSSIHSNWTQEPGASTITENGTYLTIADSVGASKDWWSLFNAPNINMSIESVDFTTKVYVSGLVVASRNSGGIANYLTGAKYDYYQIRLENAGGNHYAMTRSTLVGDTGVDVGLIDGCWIALVRRGIKMESYYSTNDSENEPDLDSMTLLHSFANKALQYWNNRLALFATKEDTDPTINIQFRKFRLMYPY